MQPETWIMWPGPRIVSAVSASSEGRDGGGDDVAGCEQDELEDSAPREGQRGRQAERDRWWPPNSKELEKLTFRLRAEIGKRGIYSAHLDEFVK